MHLLRNLDHNLLIAYEAENNIDCIGEQEFREEFGQEKFDWIGANVLGRLNHGSDDLVWGRLDGFIAKHLKEDAPRNWVHISGRHVVYAHLLWRLGASLVAGANETIGDIIDRHHVRGSKVIPINGSQHADCSQTTEPGNAIDIINPTRTRLFGRADHYGRAYDANGEVALMLGHVVLRHGLCKSIGVRPSLEKFVGDHLAGIVRQGTVLRVDEIRGEKVRCDEFLDYNFRILSDRVNR